MKLSPARASWSLCVAVLVVGLIAIWPRDGKSTQKEGEQKQPPAVVREPADETKLNTIVLTAQAETRLGIKTAPVSRKPLPRRRTLGGEVVVPPGKTINVTAPLSGILKSPDAGVPAVGIEIAPGQVVFTMVPLMTPEARTTLAASLVDAEGQIEGATVQVEAARIALDRANRLFSGEAGSRRAVDEAQAQFDLAGQAVEAAKARREVLAQAVGAVDAGTLVTLNIESPAAGLLRNVLAQPGQTVAAAAPLFEVVDLSTVWVRVPVYVGDATLFDAESDAQIGGLAAQPGAAHRLAHPVEAPPTADPLASTVDLYYELDNAKGGLAPGQRVAATLALRGDDEQRLVVPWSAVLVDINGGTWVYERIEPLTYVRRRVQVRYVVGESAALDRGPKPGADIVTEGAAELFGTEFGFGK